MRVLVACEFSGVVRDAFRTRGHDAWSCDVIETERPGNHYQGDVRDILTDGWDLMIAHPPCTYLCVSGSQEWPHRKYEQAHALDFVKELLSAPIPQIALENPVGVIGTVIRKPNQTIQPWQFGHDEVKTTCLWLHNLPRLIATKIIPAGATHTRIGDLPPIKKRWQDGRGERLRWLPPSPTRGRERSRTFPGIAEAMASQWG